MRAIIQYFGQRAVVRCDGNCQKAWGHCSRPRHYLSEHEDDFEWLADDELGTAPEDPGTYEGADGKPTDSSEFPNKWCVRECERCTLSTPDEPHKLINFRTRISNNYEEVK